MLSDAVHNYAWDARNHLATIDSGSTGSFMYDPAGRRTTKVISGTQTNFLYDLANPVQELSGTTPTANLLTGGLDEYFTRTDTLGTLDFLTDGVGSTAVLTDSTGSKQTQYSYDPFGNTAQAGTSTASSFAFTERENDNTGLYFNRARYYDPAIGRFVSEDPIGLLGGSNFYAYVENDPINSIDPLGLAQCLYEVGRHTLSCISTNDPSNQPVIGANSGLSICMDKQKCEGLPFLGPIPPGKYQMNKDLRPGHQTWYRLESIPPVRWWEYYTGLRRGGFALHLGTLSEGCINVDKTNPAAAQQYQQLLQLLDSEQGDNFLFVEQ